MVYPGQTRCGDCQLIEKVTAAHEVMLSAIEAERKECLDTIEQLQADLAEARETMEKVISTATVIDARDQEHLAERDRLRAALEEIAAGDGQCNSKYGPGCDCACKSFAWRALEDGK